MRRKMAGLLLLLLLLAAVNVAQSEDKYFANGGTLRMLLNATRSETTDILWKFNENLLAESTQNVPPLLEYFPPFKNRTKLNIVTADLEIANMTGADAGVYSVEFNGRLRASYNATLIRLIEQKPKVMIRTLTCEAGVSAFCLLTCKANTTQAGPVTFSWRFGTETWEELGVNTNVTKIHSHKETITCRVKNPLNEKESESIDNPLYEPPNVIIPVVLSVLAIGALVLGGGLFVAWKKDMFPFKKKVANQPHSPEEGDGLNGKSPDDNAA